MEKRKFAGNCIFILGVFAIYMLNLNFYNVYIKMRSINYVIAAAVFTAVFLCYVDFKLIFKDRLFIAVLCINAIAALFIVVNGGVNTAALTVYIFTLCLYLYDKVKFSKIQILILAIFIGAFFIYWTIDVKGYFKGYSINFGGLVLISGFVFLVVLLETLKYCVINFCDKKFVFLKKYPYYITFLETILFYIGAKIIAYYQSRTGIMVLITFALILVIPKKLMYKGITKLLCIAGAFIWMIILPLVYIYIANKGIINDLEIFYRPVIGNRASNWDVLYTLVKQHPIKGNGSIYIMEGSSFREGFLDCCNGFLQIAVVYGIVIAVCVFGMLIYVLYKQSIRITGNPFAMTAFIGTLTFIITSSSESFIFNPIFIVAFAGIIYVTNSYIEIYENVEDSDIYVAYKKRFDSSFLKKFVPVFSVTLMLCVMYFILGPLEIFYSNYLEFDFNTIDFILYFIVISIVLTMGISLVLASFRDVFSKIYCAVFLGVGIASYIQYMFLNATLSNVDGIPEFGPSIGPKYYISVAVFILAILVSVICNLVVLKMHCEVISKYVSLALSLVMATAVVTVSLSLLKAENKPNYGIVFDATNEYVMGSEENTVVIVLDTFGRDILEEELSEHPEALDVLHDFTFYDEEDSVYAPTFPSFVHFLTEYEYNGEPREEYEKTAFTSESSKKFFDEIYSRGYNVEINTRDILTGEYMQYIADNVKSVKKEVNKKEVRRELSKLSAYRYVPYFLKPYFYVMNPGVYTTAYDVKTPQVFNQSHYDNMINGGMQLSDTVKKRVGIYHYYGMHKSYMNDEFAHATEPDTTTRWQTMQGLWVVVDTFFNLMKENGIYDNSTIIVMSDHGVCYDHTGYDHFYTDSIFFMKKPEEKHDEVVRNHAPLTHHEFQRIILESLK